MCALMKGCTECFVYIGDSVTGSTSENQGKLHRGDTCLGPFIRRKSLAVEKGVGWRNKSTSWAGTACVELGGGQCCGIWVPMIVSLQLTHVTYMKVLCQE